MEESYKYLSPGSKFLLNGGFDWFYKALKYERIKEYILIAWLIIFFTFLKILYYFLKEEN